MQWKTRKAKPARKSRGDRYPATGLMVNPVRSGTMQIYFLVGFFCSMSGSFFNESKPTPEEARHVLQLRDVVLPKVAIFGQQRKVLQVFPAGVGGVQLVQLPVDDSPRLHLLLCELDPRNGIPTAMGKSSRRQGRTSAFPKQPRSVPRKTHCLWDMARSAKYFRLFR